jgi:hypothetical protein
MCGQDTPRRMIRCEVGVPHCGRDVAMPQLFLNGPNIDTSHDPLTRPKMPEIVKPDPFQIDGLASCIERPSRIALAVLRQRQSKNIFAPDHAR